MPLVGPILYTIGINKSYLIRVLHLGVTQTCPLLHYLYLTRPAPRIFVLFQYFLLFSFRVVLKITYMIL